MEAGGFASDLLSGLSLDPRDAALATELVLGVLRYRSQLDFLIDRYSGRRSASLDPEVILALRLGIYQLRYLDRIPRHAAVDESVELVKQSAKRAASGLVNAVLRKVNRNPVDWPSRDVALSHPSWLLERWDRAFGRPASDAIAQANLAAPETYIRVPAHRNPPEEAEPTEVPGAWRVRNPAAGFRLQDISSQAIVPLLDLRPGQRFLDLCASPGNKTAQACESGVRAVAADRTRPRLAALRGLGIPIVQLDGTRPLPFPPVFERILLDAPCSGTGTLRRNPEIKWRLRPERLAEYAARQRELLREALAVLRPGGQLVYSTCSLEPEENECVVEGLNVQAKQVLRRLPGRDPGDGFFAAVIER